MPLEERGIAKRGEVLAGRGRRERAWVGGCGASGLKLGRHGTRGAHLKHAAHVRDAGGVPAGNVRVETRAETEAAHVGDDRDVPAGDGAALRRGARQSG